MVCTENTCTKNDCTKNNCTDKGRYPGVKCARHWVPSTVRAQRLSDVWDVMRSIDGEVENDVKRRGLPTPSFTKQVTACDCKNFYGTDCTTTCMTCVNDLPEHERMQALDKSISIVSAAQCGCHGCGGTIEHFDLAFTTCISLIKVSSKYDYPRKNLEWCQWSEEAKTKAYVKCKSSEFSVEFIPRDERVWDKYHSTVPLFGRHVGMREIVNDYLEAHSRYMGL